MQQGTVKFFNNKKGFGFIVPDDNSEELFVHYSEIQMEGFKILKEGQRVSYTSTKGPKGAQATSVQVVE